MTCVRDVSKGKHGLISSGEGDDGDAVYGLTATVVKRQLPVFELF